MTIAVMPAAEPADAGDEGLGERRPAVGLDRGEELQDLEPLARAAVGREDRQPVGVDGHAHGAVLAQRLVGDRRRGADRDLGRRLVARARPGSTASRSRKIQASAVCSRSNSLTWISPCRAVVCQWMRFIESPGA